MRILGFAGHILLPMLHVDADVLQVVSLRATGSALAPFD